MKSNLKHLLSRVMLMLVAVAGGGIFSSCDKSIADNPAVPTTVTVNTFMADGTTPLPVTTFKLVSVGTNNTYDLSAAIPEGGASTFSTEFLVNDYSNDWYFDAFATDANGKSYTGNIYYHPVRGQAQTLNVNFKAATVDVVIVTAGETYLKWDGTQEKLVETAIPTGAHPVQNYNGNVLWAGTYVVEDDDDVTIDGKITLDGNVDLIIKDGAKLTVNQIDGNNNKLYIYGQAQKDGELVVHCSAGNAISNLSMLEVHSAKVTATSDDDNSGGISGISTFNVYGGSVDAKGTSEDGGYGIYLNGNVPMNIYGGEVKAEGTGYSPDGYGITSYSVVDVTVHGGKLWAGNANNKALNRIILNTGSGLTTSTSDNGSSWTPWGYSDTPGTKYVRVGY